MLFRRFRAGVERPRGKTFSTQRVLVSEAPLILGKAGKCVAFLGKRNDCLSEHSWWLSASRG